MYMRTLTKLSKSDFIDQHIAEVLGGSIIKKVLVGDVAYLAVRKHESVTAYMVEIKREGDYLHSNVFHESEQPEHSAIPYSVFKELDEVEKVSSSWYSDEDIENMKKWRGMALTGIFASDLKKQLKFNDFFELAKPKAFENGKQIKVFRKIRFKQKGSIYLEAGKSAGGAYRILDKGTGYQFNLEMNEIASINGIGINSFKKAIKDKLFEKQSNYTPSAQLNFPV